MDEIIKEKEDVYMCALNLHKLRVIFEQRN